MTAKFKTFDAATNTLTLGHPPGHDSHHVVAPNVSVILDNKPSRVGDLLPDDDVDLSGDDPVTSLTVRRLSPLPHPAAQHPQPQPQPHPQHQPTPHQQPPGRRNP